MQEVKSPKKPFLYYCLIVATIMVLLNSLVFPNVLKHSVKEVDYNTFMKMTENKEIGKVNIDSGEIIFTDKSEEKMYKTGVMDDYMIPGQTFLLRLQKRCLQSCTFY